MKKSYKVKSNVDLDILKNYGYEKDGNDYTKDIDGNWWNCLLINTDGHITNFIEEVGYWTFDEPDEEDIQDLIKAGIVEEDLGEENE